MYIKKLKFRRKINKVCRLRWYFLIIKNFNLLKNYYSLLSYDYRKINHKNNVKKILVSRKIKLKYNIFFHNSREH